MKRTSHTTAGRKRLRLSGQTDEARLHEVAGQRFHGSFLPLLLMEGQQPLLSDESVDFCRWEDCEWNY